MCEDPGRCQYFLPKKKRQCKMTAGVGKKLCGEHEITDKTEHQTDRIPCPLDPAHSVDSRKLAKHLKICNSRPKNEPEYVSRGLNCGASTEPDIEDFRLCDLESDELQTVISQVNEVFALTEEPQVLEDRCHEVLATEIAANPTYGPQTLKRKTIYFCFRHSKGKLNFFSSDLQQTGSLLGIADSLGLLKANTAFVEYGAGKGACSFYLSKALEGIENTCVLLVDRASMRHKKDNKIEDRSTVQRIRADIADLDLSKLKIGTTKPEFVGFGKHLCGPATDLAIRCILNGNLRGSMTRGFLIALCCHHRMTWRDFIAKDFLSTFGIHQREFAIITKMTSWLTCGTGLSREAREGNANNNNNNNASGLTRGEREQMGLKCKRILNHARKVALEKEGYTCYFVQYIDKSVTLENVCMVGVLKQK